MYECVSEKSQLLWPAHVCVCVFTFLESLLLISCLASCSSTSFFSTCGEQKQPFNTRRGVMWSTPFLHSGGVMWSMSPLTAVHTGTSNMISSAHQRRKPKANELLGLDRRSGRRGRSCLLWDHPPGSTGLTGTCLCCQLLEHLRLRMFLCSSSSVVGLWLKRLKDKSVISHLSLKESIR